MKTHLALVAQVADISPILALRSLFQWEYEFESSNYEPSMVVRIRAADEACRDIFLSGAESPCLTTELAGDYITLHRTDMNISADLATVLSAIGMGRGHSTASAFRAPAEQLYDRVLTLDNAWVLVRRLRATMPADADHVATAQLILQLAIDWHVLRTELLNKGESKVRTERESEIIARAREFASWGIPTLQSVELLPDPRGSAVNLHVEGYHEMAVSALRFDWPTGRVELNRPSSSDVKRAERGRYDVVPTQVAESVLGVLNAVAVQGNAVRIVGRLGKVLYGKVDELLQGLGGSWHTGQQAHVFDAPPAALIEEVVRTGEILLPRDYEYFETQPPQVRQVIDLARLEPGMRVLEPEAGRGALAMAAAEIVGKDHVTCFELMPRNVEHLSGLGFDIQKPQDFLAIEPTPAFDRVLLNPPFAGGRDIAHILHAVKFLRPGGRLVAIASTQWRERVTKPTAAFQAMLASLGAEVHDIPRGAFKAAGTDVPTTLIAFDVGAQPAECERAVAPADDRLEQLEFF
jgi:protein-L-isoaspartate O-methyltransferase